MAGPISHIVLALKILSLLPSTIDKKEFIVGTSFPDIRYLAKLDRESTHIEPVSWNDVVNEPSSFRAGMLFHNLVDNVRIKYLEVNFYNRYSDTNFSQVLKERFPGVIKMVEDTVLYSKNNDWQEIISYFDTIYEQEKAFCPDISIVKKWHSALKELFYQSPSNNSINEFLQKVSPINLWAHTETFNMPQIYDCLLAMPIFASIVNSFYDNFENLILANEPLTLQKVEQTRSWQYNDMFSYAV